MFVDDLFDKVLNDTKDSIVYCAISSTVKNIFTTNENDNIIYNQYKGIKETISFTQQNIIYNVLKYIIDFSGFREDFINVFCVFLTSYLLGKRNGYNFAIKNGLVAVVIGLGQKYIRFL